MDPSMPEAEIPILSRIGSKGSISPQLFREKRAG
jgi:hypothetical protein